MAAILVRTEAHDTYWDNVERDLMVGLILLVLEAGSARGWPVSIGPDRNKLHLLLRSEEVMYQ